MRRRHLTAAAASLLLAVGGAVVSPAVLSPALLSPAVASPALAGQAGIAGQAGQAAPSPTPTPRTPTLPVPRPSVDPRLSVGGERLASMGVVVDLPAGVPAPPALRNVSWLLADLDTGEVIAAKAAHARLLPASTLKTLTALTLIPRVDARRSYTATAADANADGTRVGLLPGQSYTGSQLFSALLMASGNDAAYALARAGGGLPATLSAMNERARFLGAHDTLAKDPSGLDAPGQTSSAYDLALIGRAAMQLPEFRAYVTTKQIAFPGRPGKGGKRATYVVSNHNRLLYNYEGTLGIKNGYTNAAKRTFISAVSRGGKRYILTEMHGLDPSWRAQAAMYDWAFRYGDRATPVGTLVDPGTVTEPPAPPSPTTAAVPVPSSPAPPRPAGDVVALPALGSGSRWASVDAGFAPWVGFGGLGAAVLLVGVLATRALTRTTRRH